MNLLDRATVYYKKHGIKGTVKRILKGNKKGQVIDILSDLSYLYNMNLIPFSQSDFIEGGKDKITLNWIIPDVGAGSGGHINIFRFISMIESEDIHSRVYPQFTRFPDDDSLRKFVIENYNIFDKRIELFYNIDDIKFAHGTIATSWQTAYFLKNFNNTISKFYFVQDYEPYFYARGSFYEFADNTYNWQFRGITAGEWLKNICVKKGMIADSFGFSYDKKLYFKKDKRDDTERICFYARPYTARRDFELGLIALDILAKKRENLEVVFFGQDVSDYRIPFRHKNLKIVAQDKLCDVYSQCDMCLVLSNTNLSLLPLEVMASNSVVVSSEGANNSWLVTEENAVLVDYEPHNIADKIIYYLDHKDQLALKREKGLEFALETDWEEEGQKVKNAILKGISEDRVKLENLV
jgi:hypothetical protein